MKVTISILKNKNIVQHLIETILSLILLGLSVGASHMRLHGEDIEMEVRYEDISFGTLEYINSIIYRF